MSSHKQLKTKTTKNKKLTAESLSLDPTSPHIPVLADEVESLLQLSSGRDYLDLTAGYGGHAARANSLVGEEHLTLVDRDPNAIEYLKRKFKQARIVDTDAANFVESAKDKYDMILVDLGISSPHVDNPERGFSLRHDGPLDMRMDSRQQLSAADLVNQASCNDLKRIFKSHSDEKAAAFLARQIVDARPFSTTVSLAEFVASIYPKSLIKPKIHPATKVFQALRMEVNDELGQLARVLRVAPGLLRPKGVLAVISFHSLEDRMVKCCFKDLSQGEYSEFASLTKKPIIAQVNEIVSNPRARSAKLRGLQRK